MKFLYNHLSVLLWLLIYIPRLILASPAEAQLYETLLSEYSTLARPVDNGNQAVLVMMGLILHQIINVDEKNQQIELHAQLNITWFDRRLSWNRKNYDGIKEIRFHKEQIWTPDLLLYNSVAEDFDTSYPVDILVHHDGIVRWKPPAIYKFSCLMNIAWFPFDSQSCHLKFGSWTYDGSKVDLISYDNGFDTSQCLSNAEWTLVSKDVMRNIQHYECCPEPYYDLVFQFIIKRKTLYYGVNLIIPCLVITLITLIGFIFPCEAGEKTSLQISIMLSICIFQNYVSEMSPATSDSVPFLGFFFLYCLLYLAGSVVSTTVSLAIHNRSSKSHFLSHMMVKILLSWMPYICMIRRPPRLVFEMKVDSKDTLCCDVEKLGRQVSDFELLELVYQGSEDGSIDKDSLAQLLLLEQMVDEIKEFKEIFDKDHEDYLVEKDYEFMAIVVDRASLLISSTFIFISTLLFFLSVL